MEMARADNQSAVMLQEGHGRVGRAAGSIQVNSSFTVTWPQSPPFEYFSTIGEKLVKYDWYRVSYCLKPS